MTILYVKAAQRDLQNTITRKRVNAGKSERMRNLKPQPAPVGKGEIPFAAAPVGENPQRPAQNFHRSGVVEETPRPVAADPGQARAARLA